MFSGIVEHTSQIVSTLTDRQTTRLFIKNVFAQQDLKIGESIAVSGVCLTLVEFDPAQLIFDLAEETLRRSTLQDRKVGDYVNLERALRVDARLDGHLVTGHVDAKAELVARTPEHNSERYEWLLPKQLASLIAEKGSVALDGVSLTVGEVSSERFAVYIIPHTAQMTTLHALKVGEYVNLEVDLIARYVHRSLEFLKSN